jgi:predicted phage terminase large subunit-like protein
MTESREDKIIRLKKLYALRERRLEKTSNLTQQDIDIRGECEESLSAFIQHAWRYIDPSPYVHGWHIDAISEHLQAQARGEIRHLLINQPPRTMKSISVSVAYAPWVWAQSDESALCGPHVSFLYASYAQTLSFRDSLKARRLIASPFYQKLWGNRFSLTGDQNTKSRFDNSHGGYRIATSVGGALTGEGALICAVDDGHNSIEAESELVRQGVIDWWDQSLSTRLNDPKTGVYLVTMQRLNEADLAGHIIDKMDGDWTHLCLPMEFEADRKCYTSIGFEDPRTVDGELLWPERVGEREVASLKASLGPYGCTPKESPVLMGDLSLKPISEVKIGDEVVGFEEKADRKNRRSLKKSIVKNIYTYHADVSNIKLSSGKIIRCTADHKWYIGKQAKRRQGKYPDDPLYRPAIIGRRLMRICDPELPNLLPEQERKAGWLAGFFDGEGSVTLCNRRGQKRPNGKDYKSSAQISFHQTAEKNLPLCEKLEEYLREFNFEFSCMTPKRQLQYSHWQQRRHYILTTGGKSCLQLFQKFLHIVQPVKWRQRLIDGAYTANFISSEEEVVSIQYGGQETVYALETTTGNYVVWGLASSNSAGQLQQRPEPRGGGIIKRDWWQLWDSKEFPPFDFIVASLDAAYTEKQENDYSALTVWGVFRDKNNMPKIMCMYAWQDRLDINSLVMGKKDPNGRYAVGNENYSTLGVGPICVKFKVDRLLIENKASGHSVAQEIRRLFGAEKFGVQLVNPGAQDKVARLYSVQHLWSEGIIFAPEKGWADDLLIPQISAFPKGKHDDLVDSASQAIRWLRDNGFALRKEEQDAILREEFAPRGKQEALYDV